MKSVKHIHKRPKRFNLTKEQYEGLARFVDTIAASAFIGAVVASRGRSDLKVWEIVLLFASCLTMIYGSLLLRSPK